MKCISLLSMVLCIHAISSCMEKTLSTDTNTTGGIDWKGLDMEFYKLIHINNQTKSLIEAHLEGFKETNIYSPCSTREANQIITTTDINPNQQHTLKVITAYLPSAWGQSIEYRLCVQALKIKYKNNQNSEIHFFEPLKAKSNNFVIEEYKTDQGSFLKI